VPVHGRELGAIKGPVSARKRYSPTVNCFLRSLAYDWHEDIRVHTIERYCASLRDNNTNKIRGKNGMKAVAR